jgi:transaldolase
MSVLRELLDLGQSIWLDNISREIIRGGDLHRKVQEGLTGVTSNPTIFEKAISGGSDYDAQIREVLSSTPGISNARLIQEMMIRDMQTGTDVLRPVFDRAQGHDGFVSVEVTPSSARNTEATQEEVRFLWERIDRPNLMVKIPATVEGLSAIEQMLYEGININITLVFSIERYRLVAQAYLKALERRIAEGKPIDRLASVASIFVSRVDTMVDPQLTKRIEAGEKNLEPLLGRAAVANAKMVYQAFKEIFTSARFAALAARGATVQRPLWGSTGTKNPAYSDLKYVESLIGPNTVNTVPPQTYAAILRHGKAALTIERDLDAERQSLAGLRAAGIDMRQVTAKLEEEGVASFEKSFDGLLGFLDKKRAAVHSSAAVR